MQEFMPSMEALRAFDSAARHRSFTLAARETGLTQSAISRVIGALERKVGTRLFERLGRRVVLTEAGEAYARGIEAHLDAIASATWELKRYSRGTRNLSILTLPTFGSHWLAPRLRKFAVRHPAIRLNVATRLDGFDFATGDADCALFYGNDATPGTLSDRLVDVELIPVCAPGLLPGGERAATDFERLPLLQHTRLKGAWSEWLAWSGRRHPAPEAGHGFDTFESLIQAAIAGMGVALARTLLVEADIASGRLIRLHDMAMRTEDAYCLVYPERKRNKPEFAAFRAWILRESRPQRRGEAPVSMP